MFVGLFVCWFVGGCWFVLDAARRTLNLDSLNNLTSLSLTNLGVWCLLLEDLLLRNCACFEDESIVMLLGLVPALFIEVALHRTHTHTHTHTHTARCALTRPPPQLSRFPSPTLKPHNLRVHRSTVKAAFAATNNDHRASALDKKRLYGLVN